MYAAVTIGQAQPDKIDEMLRTYQEHVLPAVRQLHGFRGGQILGDRQTGKFVGIALYETEADAQAAGVSPVQQQLRDLMAGVVSGPPSREVYEVILQL